MYVLTCPPVDTRFVAVNFPKGSREEFDNVMHRVKNFWGSTAPNNVAEWIDFEKTSLIPQNDSVDDYLDKNPEAFYIPLINELFGKIPTDLEFFPVNDTNRSISNALISELPVAIAQPIVTWSKRGSKEKNAQYCRELSAPSGSNPNLEAAMVDHNKPVVRRTRALKEKSNSEKILDVFHNYMQSGQDVTFAEFAKTLKEVSAVVI
jgi:hypothetical protein